MSFQDYVDERMLISHDVLGKKEMKVKVIVTLKIGVLDPLGANLDNGKELYFKLIKDISSSLKKC